MRVRRSTSAGSQTPAARLLFQFPEIADPTYASNAPRVRDRRARRASDLLADPDRQPAARADAAPTAADRPAPAAAPSEVARSLCATSSSWNFAIVAASSLVARLAQLDDLVAIVLLDHGLDRLGAGMRGFLAEQRRADAQRKARRIPHRRHRGRPHAAGRQHACRTRRDGPAPAPPSPSAGRRCAPCHAAARTRRAGPCRSPRRHTRPRGRHAAFRRGGCGVRASWLHRLVGRVRARSAAGSPRRGSAPRGSSTTTALSPAIDRPHGCIRQTPQRLLARRDRLRTVQQLAQRHILGHGAGADRRRSPSGPGARSHSNSACHAAMTKPVEEGRGRAGSRRSVISRGPRPAPVQRDGDQRDRAGGEIGVTLPPAHLAGRLIAEAFRRQ